MKSKVLSIMLILMLVLTSVSTVFAYDSWSIDKTINYLYHDGDVDNAPVKTIAIGIDALYYQYELTDTAPATQYMFEGAGDTYFTRKLESGKPVANLTKTQVVDFFESVKGLIRAANEEEEITADTLNDVTLVALADAVDLTENADFKDALSILFTNEANIVTSLTELANDAEAKAEYVDLAFGDPDIWDLVAKTEGRRPSSIGGSSRSGGASNKFSGTFTGSVATALYNDVAEDHWAYEFIEKLSEKGVVNGTGSQSFEPDGNVTRAAFVKMMAELIDAPVAFGESKFDDVGATAWYNPYVIWGYDNGIILGYSDTEFRPDELILREQMAAILVRFVNKFGYVLPQVAEKQLFADDNEIEPYANEFVYQLQQSGVLGGVGDNRFAPKDNTTRAEACKVIYEIDKIINAE